MARDVSEVDLSAYLAKDPTDLQVRFAEYLMDQVGYDPSKAKTKEEAFKEGVRLATAMRMIFQASPENQEVLAGRRAEREEPAETKPAKKAAPAPAPAKKASKKAAKAAPEEPAEEPVARPAKKAAKKAVTSPVSSKRRSAPQTADAEDEAPF